jgi:hypothetical protein
VVVILVLGVLATIAIPKFLNLNYQATVRAEQRVMLEVRSALHADRAKNITEGCQRYGFDDYYAEDNLIYRLLAMAPPDWKQTEWYSSDVTYLMCPHCTSMSPDAPGPGAVIAFRARMWTPGYYPSLQRGQMKVYRDRHGGVDHPSGMDISQWKP